MKYRIYILVIFLCTAIHIMGQDLGPFPAFDQYPSKNTIKKNNIKRITCKICYETDGRDTAKAKVSSVIHFDRNGNRTKVEHILHKDALMNDTCVFYYNKKEQLVYDSVAAYVAPLSYFSTYRYDELDRMIEKKTVTIEDTIVETFSYKNDTVFLNSKFAGPVETVEANAVMIKNASGNIVRILGNINHIWVLLDKREYDINGNITSWTRYNKEGIHQGTLSYKYNPAGLPVLREGYMSNMIYHYEYY